MRSKGFLSLVLCVGSTVGLRLPLQAQTASPKTSSSTQAARLSGTFRYAGGAQDEDARKAAIEKAIASMSSFTRSTARNRISATTKIMDTYTLSLQPGKILVRAPERPDMISGDKGESADYIYNGKKSALTQTVSGDRLTQVFVSDDGKRENTFTLSQDGQALQLKVMLSSSRLSTPVTYTLPYKRVD